MRSAFPSVSLARHAAAALAVAAIIAAPARGQAQSNRPTRAADSGEAKGVGRYADVNGIRFYCEIRGKGQPLILLHGGLGAIEMFGPNLPALARKAPGDRRRSAGSRADGRHRSTAQRLTHYTVFSDPALAAAVIPFLDEPAPKGK